MLRSHIGRDVSLSDERLESMTRSGGWPNRCLIDYFDDQVKLRPDKTYVIAHRADADNGTPRSFTFRQFDAIVSRVAAGLARCGVASGDFVSYQLPNWWEFLAISLACSRIGAVTNPLMPILRERELTFMLGLAESKILIVPKSFRGFDYPSMARSVQRTVPTLKSVLVVGGEAGESFEQVLFEDNACPPALTQSPNELLQLMYTSGTTGEPKGVMHSSNTLYANVVPFAQRLKITDKDVILCPTPLAHQLGYLFGLLMPAMIGSTVVLQDVWNAALCAQLIHGARGTFCLGATPYLADLTDLPNLRDYDVSSLRMFVSGGAPIPPPLVVRAKERLRAHIISAWGMTEVSAVTTVHLDDQDELVSGTDGIALPHMEVGVFDEQDREMPRGQSGRLKARGASVFLGYLKRPNLYNHNAEGWFDTGDLARMNDEGYIRITGRSKDVIIRGGENIPVVEIENILYRHPAVRAVAIVGMPDPRLGERAVAYIVVKPDAAIDLSQVTAFLSDHKVARSYFPERVEILPEMPMTATGKIQKFVLREWATKLAHGGVRRTARTSNERPTMTPRTIKVYTDYKSPYAYLAKDAAYALERETGVALEWLPYTLDIAAYLGSSNLDASGQAVDRSRNSPQWRRVKYSYMDCRREANRRGLIIRGPHKIFDSTLANIGMLYAKRQGVFRAYHDCVFERFWKRDLDIEDAAALAAVLVQLGADVKAFVAFLEGEGRQQLEAIQQQAEGAGVFGVPSYVLDDGDLYWGREHLPRIRELLTAAA